MMFATVYPDDRGRLRQRKLREAEALRWVVRELASQDAEGAPEAEEAERGVRAAADRVWAASIRVDASDEEHFQARIAAQQAVYSADPSGRTGDRVSARAAASDDSRIDLNAPQEFVPGVWIGGTQAARGGPRLSALGIERVCQCHASGPSTVHHAGMAYHVVPLDDRSDQPLVEHLDAALRFIRPGTLIHCGAGVSRSGAVAMAYVMRTLGLGVDEALQVLRAARPLVRPNGGFMAQLQRWEAASSQRPAHAADGTRTGGADAGGRMPEP